MAEEDVVAVEGTVRRDIEQLSTTMNGWLHGRDDVTLVTAESLTGGGVSAALTAIQGTSSYFLGGIVAYSNPAKAQVLHVPEAILANPGAVSAPCAEAMANGVRDVFSATFSVATTGLAGPGGGSARKPVGLVFVAVAGPDGTTVEQHQFAGEREDVTEQAIHAGLSLLHDRVRSWLDAAS